MSHTFVLVHGGFHGGWCWAPVAERLRARGHRVFTPTMTGLGERVHLTAPGVDIQTHVQDLVAVLEAEELEDVVLVGHSYGGGPVTGVADRVPGRLRQVIYLDAVIGTAGRASLDGMPPDVYEAVTKNVIELNGTKVQQPISAAYLGVTDPEQQAWVDRRCTTQPLASATTPLQLDHPPGNGLPCSYIRCTEPAHPSMDEHCETAVQLGWPLHRLATGHDAMVSAPEELTELLEAIATGAAVPA